MCAAVGTGSIVRATEQLTYKAMSKMAFTIATIHAMAGAVLIKNGGGTVERTRDQC
jgi:hypothetical protein